MRVLITGGGGFIGRSVVSRLVVDGHDVTVLDRDVAGLGMLGRELRAEIRTVVGETHSPERVAAAMVGQDRVAHLAAGSSFLMYEERPVQETAGAIVGFHNVLDLAVRHDVGRLVFLSTSAVYEGNPVPYREDMRLRPPDLKAMAKEVNEKLADQYAERYGVETVALRPFSVYGPGETTKGPYANIVSLFAWAMASGRPPVLWGNGRQTRDFIYVDDVATAVDAAISGSAVGAFNVGTGVETSFAAVIDLLNEVLGTALAPVGVDVPISVYASRLLADTTHARSELGFVAEVSLREGVERVVANLAALPPDVRARLGALHEQFSRGVEYVAEALPPLTV